MRQFYKAYREDVIISPLVREIGWTKNLVILERCRGEADEREFYIRRTQQFGWSKNVLIH